MKEEILEQAEVLTEAAIESVFVLINKYIEESTNKIDDAILPFLPMAKSFVLKYAEKIDGE